MRNFHIFELQNLEEWLGFACVWGLKFGEVRGLHRVASINLGGMTHGWAHLTSRRCLEWPWFS